MLQSRVEASGALGSEDAMATEAQWARRRIIYAGVAPLLMARSGAIDY